MQQWKNGVRQERTEWRDMDLSKRHRTWGFNCPAVDLDFLMVEYNVGKPVGLIEYKHFKARFPNLDHPTYRALSELADAAGLPFMLAFYWPGCWAFKITPVNGVASEHFDNDEVLTEYDFVSRLYKLRRLVLTATLEKELSRDFPWEVDS